MSFQKLINRIQQTQSPVVVGLDPMPNYIPDYIKEKAYNEYGNTLRATAEAFYEFNRGIIDAVYDIAPAVKPQCAYYEMLGYEGVRALARTIAYARERGMYVISDGKRNDIGSTMEAYASAYLGGVDIEGSEAEPFGADALTINGYLGTDGIMPLLTLCDRNDRGIFVLVKTSNKSSGELQDKLIDGEPVYMHMAAMCEQWGSLTKSAGGYTAVGAVVGATYPEQLKQLRKAMPHTFFLVPGYGAQGGGAGDVVAAFDNDGLGAVINSSRGIICAWQKGGNPKGYAKAAREEVIRMRDDIRAHL